MIGGRSWNALTEQCLLKAARDLCERISRAAVASVVANTSEDLWVVSSSSSVRSHLGLDTRVSWRLAYCGLHAMSSW